MGLRDKVALIVIAVVLLIVCSLCIPQSVKNNPLEKFTHKQKYGKSKLRSVDKEKFNCQWYSDDARIRPVYKTFNFSEVDYPSVTSPKIPNYIPSFEFDSLGTSSVDVLSDSIILDNLKKDKRNKRKNKDINKINAKEELPIKSIVELYKNQDVFSYLTQGKLFDETQYPLSGADKWNSSLINPSYNEVALYVTKGDFISQNKVQKKKMMNAFLHHPYDWANKPKEELKICSVKNEPEIKNNKQLKKNLISSFVKVPKDKTMTAIPTNLNQNIEKLYNNLIKSPNVTKKKMKALNKIVDESRKAALTKKQTSPDKIILEAIAKRLKPRPFSKSLLSNNDSYVCFSKNSTVLCNITHVDNTNATLNNDSVPNLANVLTKSINQENFCELAKLISEIQELQNIDIETISTINDFTLLHNNHSTSDLMFEPDPHLEFKQENISNNYSKQVDNKSDKGTITFISEMNSTYTMNSSLLNSVIIEPLLKEINMECSIVSYPGFSTSSQIQGLQVDGFPEDPVMFIDDNERKCDKDGISSKRLQVKIMNLNDHGNMKKTFPTTNLSIENIICEPVISHNAPSVIEETSHNNHLSEVITELSKNNIYRVSDNLIEVITEPKESEAIHEELNGNIHQPEITNKLADNLREIIATPTSTNAFIDDLHEIIRLLTVWNSRIDDSDDIIYNTGKAGTNTDNSNNAIGFLKEKNTDLSPTTSNVSISKD